MLASMSDEQIKAADQLKDDLQAGNTVIGEAKKAYDEAVAKICADAKTYLEAEKAERKNA